MTWKTGHQVPMATRVAVALGDRYREINTILMYLKRYDREPTQIQKDRLNKLREEIRDLKNGKFQFGGLSAGNNDSAPSGSSECEEGENPTTVYRRRGVTSL